MWDSGNEIYLAGTVGVRKKIITDSYVAFKKPKSEKSLFYVAL